MQKMKLKPSFVHPTDYDRTKVLSLGFDKESLSFLNVLHKDAFCDLLKCMRFSKPLDVYN